MLAFVGCQVAKQLRVRGKFKGNPEVGMCEFVPVLGDLLEFGKYVGSGKNAFNFLQEINWRFREKKYCRGKISFEWLPRQELSRKRQSSAGDRWHGSRV